MEIFRIQKGEKSHQFLLIFATRAGTISMNSTNAGIGAGCEGLSRVIQIRQVHGL